MKKLSTKINRIKKILFDVILNNRLFVIFTTLSIFILYIIAYCHIENLYPETSTISSDGFDYYIYLPAVFIFHDLDFDFVNKVLPIYYIHPHCYFFGFTRFPCGNACLMTPFFLIAHYYTKLYTGLIANGYSYYYQMAMAISAIFYWFCGITLTYNIIIKKIKKNIATLVCLAITFGAGIVFYTSIQSTYSHIYSFFSISLLCFLILKKFKNAYIKYFLVGLILGLIVSIRISNILCFILFLLFNVNSFDDLKKRFLEFFNLKNLIPFLAGFIIFTTPVCLYWYYKTGHLIINSYHPEWYMQANYPNVPIGISDGNGFDFLHTKILESMFSLKKGLFVYYPVLFMSVIGLFYLKNYFKNFSNAIIVFLITIIYFYSSFEDWWAGNSFGLRFYIDYLAIFAILIASFLQKMSEKNKKLYYFAIILVLILTVASFIMGCLVYNGHANRDGTLFF